ncbi:MAG: tetratricopeptide repeat protein [Elusimicrobia bacterium]|nr:tetratricopeptide repeat protein [Elusimicrobiota bacterium]
MFRTLCAALLLAWPCAAIEPAETIDLSAILDAAMVPPREKALYAPILDGAMKELQALQDKTKIQETIDAIVEREAATIDEKRRKHFATRLTLSLGGLAIQIALQEERKPKPAPVQEVPAEQDDPPPAPTQTPEEKGPPTAADIRKGANDYVTTFFPENRLGWLNTAEDATRQKDHKTALKSYKKVIDLGGGTPKVYTGYGTAAYHTGDFLKASEAAREALELDPSYRPAEALAGLSAQRLRSVSPSAKLLAGAAALMDGAARDPGSMGPGAGLPGRAEPGSAPAPGGGRPAWTPPTGAGIPAEDVLKAEGLVDQASGALGLGDYSEGGDLAARAAATDPLNPQAWTLRAVADSNLGRHRDAVYNASVALLLTPGNTTALQMRSWSFNKTGRYREALRDADITVVREPRNPFHHYNRAFAQAGLADRPGATTSLKRASDLDGRFAPTYKAAVTAPEDADLLFLFDMMGPGMGNGTPVPSPGRRRPLLYGLAGAGLLLALASLAFVLRRRR